MLDSHIYVHKCHIMLPLLRGDDKWGLSFDFLSYYFRVLMDVH